MWRYGTIEKEQKRHGDLLKAIATLKGHGLCGTGVVEAYHVWKLALLMARTLPMWKMTPYSTPERTVMVVGEALNIGEMAQCIKESMQCPVDPSMDLTPEYLVSGHPTMWPDVGFVELVSLL